MNPTRGLAALLEIINDEDWHDRDYVTYWLTENFLQDVPTKSRSTYRGSKATFIAGRLYRALEEMRYLERGYGVANEIRLVRLERAKIYIRDWRREILEGVISESNPPD